MKNPVLPFQNVSVSVSVDGTTWSTAVSGLLPDPTGLVSILHCTVAFQNCQVFMIYVMAFFLENCESDPSEIP